MSDPTEKRQVDWEAIEREYRAGQLSIREIGRLYDVTDTAIRKRAKQFNWMRDLAGKVRQAVKSTVVRNAVRNELSREPASEAETVRAFADRGARAIEGHLSRAGRLKLLADRLTEELEIYMAGGKTSVEIFVSRSDSPATIIRTLADTAERIAKIERQALNLDDAPPVPAGDAEKTVVVLPSNGRD